MGDRELSVSEFCLSVESHRLDLVEYLGKMVWDKVVSSL